MRAKHLLKMFPACFLVILLISPCLSAQGHFELGFHFGRWGIDFAESILHDVMEDTLPDILLELAQENDENLYEKDFYLDDFTFESGRNNWGVEVRWYPGGWGRSFSLGFSVERTSIRIASDITARLIMEQYEWEGVKNATFDIQADGQFEINPTSFHFHFRWDIFPLARIRPFFTFGVGIAGLKSLQEASLSASLTGELQIEGEETESFDESVDKTLKEIEDDAIAEGEEAFLPTLFPFIQLNFGIKGEITRNLCLLLETGIFNGFILRGGIAFRI
jgi:hypothetical protein